jgi:hypothetical protein
MANLLDWVAASVCMSIQEHMLLVQNFLSKALHSTITKVQLELTVHVSCN